jgi:bifunctional non-homologous end joining protein LigD
MPKRTQTRFVARMIEGAVPADMPGFISPQLATLKSKAPVGSKWLHEIKYDGYRLQIHLNKGLRIFTRNGHDWTNRFPVIASAFDIPVERAIFDGEVVVVHEGRTNFSELQADLASGKQRRMAFYAFDLLYLEGFSLRNSPQVERKRVLKMLFDETGLQGPLLYSEHMLTDGNEMFAASCKLGFEGIISKNAKAPYRSERNEGWLKVKCVQKGKFPVIGFVKDPTGVAAVNRPFNCGLLSSTLLTQQPAMR